LKDLVSLELTLTFLPQDLVSQQNSLAVLNDRLLLPGRRDYSKIFVRQYSFSIFFIFLFKHYFNTVGIP